jgi:hypothetical protein
MNHVLLQPISQGSPAALASKPGGQTFVKAHKKHTYHLQDGALISFFHLLKFAQA